MLSLATMGLGVLLGRLTARASGEPAPVPPECPPLRETVVFEAGEASCCHELEDCEAELQSVRTQLDLLAKLSEPAGLPFPDDGPWDEHGLQTALDAWRSECPEASQAVVGWDCHSFPCLFFVTWRSQEQSAEDIFCDAFPEEAGEPVRQAAFTRRSGPLHEFRHFRWAPSEWPPGEDRMDHLDRVDRFKRQFRQAVNDGRIVDGPM